MAFYIVDSNQYGQITLDTRSCLGEVNDAAKKSEALSTLSTPVLSFIGPKSGYFDTS